MSDVRKDNPIREEKRKKLHALKEKGIDPFPYSFDRSHSLQELREKYGGLTAGEKQEGTIIRLAGRVMTVRAMGKASFFNIQDQSGLMQIYIKPEELDETAQTSFDLLDIGDFVGVQGFVFCTKRGELSVHIQKFEILCKTLEPLPEKFHGIADIEIKYRHRHLDLIMDSDSRKVFETRSKIIREIRKFLDARGFLEVETPILQPLYGGAAARPFTTHHNALDMKLYLKISPELYLKRLIVGGFEKVYDLNKNFRNEGIDRSHNPEFTMMEWYEAYTDYNYQMKQFEDLVSHVCKEICGSTKITYQGKEIDFTTPWKRISVNDSIKEYAGVDVKALNDAQLKSKLIESGFKEDPKNPLNRGEMIIQLFDLLVEHHLWQPTFIIDHPVEISPLTKKHRVHKGLVERFEPYVANMELGNAYSELNDPEEQRARLEEQESKRGQNDEAHPMDEDFMNAIDVGMPPTGGVGLGIERLVMVLTDRPSIRDIILFPTMKIKYT
ncbi:MAG: lysine--tRNA ligase [Bdellovibrionales bacterium]